jgi:hypothetical protein
MENIGDRYPNRAQHARLLEMASGDHDLRAKILNNQPLSLDELRSLSNVAKRAIQEATGHCIDGLPRNRGELVYWCARDRAFGTIATRVTGYSGVATWSEIVDIFNRGIQVAGAKEGNTCTVTCAFPDKNAADAFSGFIQSCLGGTTPPRIRVFAGNDITQVRITGLEEFDISALGRMTAAKLREEIRDDSIFHAICGKTKREIDELGVQVGAALPKDQARELEKKISDNTDQYKRVRAWAISPNPQPLVSSPAFLAAIADLLRAELGEGASEDLRPAANPSGIEAGLSFPRTYSSSTGRPISRTPSVGQLVRDGGRKEIAGLLADMHSKPIASAWDWLTSVNPIGLIQKLLGIVESACRPLPQVTLDASVGYWRCRRIAADLGRRSGQILLNTAGKQPFDESVTCQKQQHPLRIASSRSPVTANPGNIAAAIRQRLVKASRGARLRRRAKR